MRKIVPGDVVEPYGVLADAYDVVHAHRPYAEEAAAVRKLAARYARRRGRTLLDVACGSGRHIAQFARWYACTGVDPSPAMLARARLRVPRARWIRGRMESMRLGEEFDVVTCLFSSIGYQRTEAQLRRAVRNLARHVAPGGVLVVEPWLTPGEFRPKSVHHLVAEEGGTAVLRMNSASRRGNVSQFDFHYLVGRGRRVTHAVEHHELGLFTRGTMEAALRGAGLDTRYLAGGLSSHRGLYIGVRPATAGRARRARPRPRRRLGS